MSTPVTYNGNSFNIPAYQDTGYAQGTGNLSSYLIALATGSLTLAGGNFTLTADVNFGANFGLKSLYYKSRNASPASVGIVRLGNAEIIAWRNSTDSADITMTVNSSNQLVLGATVVLGVGVNTTYTSPDGTKTVTVGCDNDGNFGVLSQTP